ECLGARCARDADPVDSCSTHPTTRPQHPPADGRRAPRPRGLAPSHLRRTPSMSRPRTLRELKAAGHRLRSVKDELRANLVARLRAGGPLLPGIVGYQHTVEPQIVNAILSRHDFILLGLRG